jgi:DNA-binding GntR family transcriptional regulator
LELKLGLKPIMTRTAADEVYLQIKSAILDGRLAPDVRLVEETLAAELNASRTPVREALIMLDFEGLARRTRKGLTVRTFSSQELIEMYEVRLVLESYATRIAAQKATPDNIQILKAICFETDRRLAEGFEYDGERIWWLVQQNKAFHSAILKMVSNEKLVSLLSNVSDLPLLYKAIFWHSPDHIQLSLHYHRTIVTAMANNNADRAALIMQEHIYEARDMMLEVMQDDNRGELEHMRQVLQGWIARAADERNAADDDNE